MADHVKSPGKVKESDMHCSPLVRWQSHLTKGSDQDGQARFVLDKPTMFFFP